MSLFRDYLRLLIVVDFVIMKSTCGFLARRVFRHAGRDVSQYCNIANLYPSETTSRYPTRQPPRRRAKTKQEMCVSGLMG
jgi:hypothetical protein